MACLARNWLNARYGWIYKRVLHFLYHFYIFNQVVIILLFRKQPLSWMENNSF